ncbi:Chaperone protein DnaJ [Diplonema papillatum]|nr:Chaperone protein DnaJ [Diplonema papillatum]
MPAPESPEACGGGCLEVPAAARRPSHRAARRAKPGGGAVPSAVGSATAFARRRRTKAPAPALPLPLAFFDVMSAHCAANPVPAPLAASPPDYPCQPHLEDLAWSLAKRRYNTRPPPPPPSSTLNSENPVFRQPILEKKPGAPVRSSALYDDVYRLLFGDEGDAASAGCGSLGHDSSGDLSQKTAARPPSVTPSPSSPSDPCDPREPSESSHSARSQRSSTGRRCSDEARTPPAACQQLATAAAAPGHKARRFSAFCAPPPNAAQGCGSNVQGGGTPSTPVGIPPSEVAAARASRTPPEHSVVPTTVDAASRGRPQTAKADAPQQQQGVPPRPQHGAKTRGGGTARRFSVPRPAAASSTSSSPRGRRASLQDTPSWQRGRNPPHASVSRGESCWGPGLAFPEGQQPGQCVGGNSGAPPTPRPAAACASESGGGGGGAAMGGEAFSLLFPSAAEKVVAEERQLRPTSPATAATTEAGGGESGHSPAAPNAGHLPAANSDNRSGPDAHPDRAKKEREAHGDAQRAGQQTSAAASPAALRPATAATAIRMEAGGAEPGHSPATPTAGHLYTAAGARSRNGSDAPHPDRAKREREAHSDAQRAGQQTSAAAVSSKYAAAASSPAALRPAAATEVDGAEPGHSPATPSAGHLSAAAAASSKHAAAAASSPAAPHVDPPRGEPQSVWAATAVPSSPATGARAARRPSPPADPDAAAAAEPAAGGPSPVAGKTQAAGAAALWPEPGGILTPFATQWHSAAADTAPTDPSVPPPAAAAAGCCCTTERAARKQFEQGCFAAARRGYAAALQRARGEGELRRALLLCDVAACDAAARSFPAAHRAAEEARSLACLCLRAPGASFPARAAFVKSAVVAALSKCLQPTRPEVVRAALAELKEALPPALSPHGSPRDRKQSSDAAYPSPRRASDVTRAGPIQSGTQDVVPQQEQTLQTWCAEATRLLRAISAFSDKLAAHDAHSALSALLTARAQSRSQAQVRAPAAAVVSCPAVASRLQLWAVEALAAVDPKRAFSELSAHERFEKQFFPADQPASRGRPHAAPPGSESPAGDEPPPAAAAAAAAAGGCGSSGGGGVCGPARVLALEAAYLRVRCLWFSGQDALTLATVGDGLAEIAKGLDACAEAHGGLNSSLHNGGRRRSKQQAGAGCAAGFEHASAVAVLREKTEALAQDVSAHREAREEHRVLVDAGRFSRAGDAVEVWDRVAARAAVQNNKKWHATALSLRAAAHLGSKNSARAVADFRQAAACLQSRDASPAGDGALPFLLCPGLSFEYGGVHDATALAGTRAGVLSDADRQCVYRWLFAAAKAASGEGELDLAQRLCREASDCHKTREVDAFLEHLIARRDTPLPFPRKPPPQPNLSFNTAPVQCYYATLGAAPNDSASRIRSLYRQRALSVHPDKCSVETRPQAEDAFKTLSEAYSVLADAAKRKAYDIVIGA